MDPPTEVLLEWSQQQTKGYRGVDIKDLSVSWKNGLALCAIIHSLDTSHFEYEPLVYQSHDIILKTTFDCASKIGIPQLIEPSDLLVDVPDGMVIESYLLSIYQHWQQHKSSQQQQQQQQQQQKPSEEPSPESEAVQQQITLLSEKNKHVDKAMSESKEIKGLLVTVEDEISKLDQKLEQQEKHNAFVKSQLSEKTSQLEDHLERERQQYDQEIAKLQKELEELKLKGPSDKQLGLKRRLDEQLEKKGQLQLVLEGLQASITALTQQLQVEEDRRHELMQSKALAEAQRSELRAKHKVELQRLQRDLMESFNTEDKLQTDLLQQNYVKNTLQTETNKLSSDVKQLDGINTRLTKQNAELKEKKQKFESELLKAKLYLEEETRILNFKEQDQQDLATLKKAKQDERMRQYDVKRSKEKLQREITSELTGTKDTYDKEHLAINSIKRDVSKIEIQKKFVVEGHEYELKKREKRLNQTKETHKHKLEKEESKHKVKSEALATKIATLSAHSQEAHAVLSVEKEKLDEVIGQASQLHNTTRSAAYSMDVDQANLREASQTQDKLKRELQKATDFLVTKHHSKKKSHRSKQRAEDNIKAVGEAIAETEAKKVELEATKDHLSREIKLTKQDLELIDKDTKKAKEEKQKVVQEKNKLMHDIEIEVARSIATQHAMNS